jgi:HSP20 family protein
MALKPATVTLPFTRPSLRGEERDREAETHWTPNTDVYLTEAGLVVNVELAGLRKEDLELVVEANQLRIRGLRRDGCRVAPCRFVVMEINYGPFATVIEVPPGYDLTRAQAAYQNGFLRVDVPALAAPDTTPFSVPVRTEAD